jgi:hypothetical protein
MSSSATYRDGGNYKKRGSVIFSNPDQLGSDSLETDLRHAFLEDGLFVAKQIRVPDVFLYADGQFSSDDHCYHEFISISSTTSGSDDTYSRSISDFILEVSYEARRGWRAFDPYDSEGSYSFLLTSRML